MLDPDTVTYLMIMTFCFVFFAYASAVVSVRHGLISLIVHSTICPIRDQQSLVFTRTFGFESAYLFVQHIRFPPKLNKNKLNKTKVPADKREYHRRVNFSSSTVFVILPNSFHVLLLFFFVRSTKIASLSSRSIPLFSPRKPRKTTRSFPVNTELSRVQPISSARQRRNPPNEIKITR